MKEVEVSTMIVHAVGKVVYEIGRWDGYLRIFHDSDRLQAAAAQLFAQIINYLVRATAFYSAPLPSPYSPCTSLSVTLT